MSTPRSKTATTQTSKEGKSTDEAMLIAILKSFDPADGKISMVDFADAMGYTNVKSACNAFNRLKTKHGLKVEKVTKPTTPKKRGNRRGRAAKQANEEDSASDGAADDAADDAADEADNADNADGDAAVDAVAESPKEETSDPEEAK
ncbi:uncharacterized protein N7483_009767 [Penicillium malachiteum]|uniref:uncharacterized protein n=1 Tax=Penicillium malachiteum TaxID=1324776 RepID=UPI0025498F01|nr:uncharacterized protein N7483_009767 [Penicillium malachiteum]KAJ5721833.1 hypothetical protein N7483_009767 [Penicillium malachiteum]